MPQEVMKHKITEIQIIPIKPVNGLVGFASFVFDETLYLGSVGIFTRPTGGYRLVYPTKKLGLQDINIFYPISKQFGQEVENLISEKFEEVMKNDRHSSIDAYVR
jgi:DNA-binding cell septation regulator SpoVG